MTATIEFGLPGVQVEPGDHICALFFGTRERDEILMSYLRAGLDAGDKCVAIVQAPDADAVAAHLATLTDVDVELCVQCAQLQVMKPAQTYLRTGTVAPQDMIAFFDDVVSAAIGRDGYPFARVTGETTWLFDEPPGAEDFIEYEVQLNDYMPTHPQVALCLYDLQRFGGGIVLDLLKTHPKVLLGGLLIDNPHYMSPENFRAARLAPHKA